uniref:Uncharacterized protein n=1 Tax=Solanum lycopersicum TaxID=4081 RepID=A0A3Q7EX46_SOLLC
MGGFDDFHNQLYKNIGNKSYEICLQFLNCVRNDTNDMILFADCKVIEEKYHWGMARQLKKSHTSVL